MSERAYALLGHLPALTISAVEPTVFEKDGEWVCVGQGGFATGPTPQEAERIWTSAVVAKRRRREAEAQKALWEEQARAAAAQYQAKLADYAEDRRIRAIKEAASAEAALQRRLAAKPALPAKPLPTRKTPSIRMRASRLPANPQPTKWWHAEEGLDIDIPLRDHEGRLRYMPLHTFLNVSEACQ